MKRSHGARRCYPRFAEAGRSSTQSRSCGTRIDTTSVLQVFPVEILLVDPVDRIPDRGSLGTLQGTGASMSQDEQQHRGGFVPVGELADTLPGLRGARSRDVGTSPGTASPRSTSRLHGAAARAVFPAAHQPGRPPAVREAQRAVHVGDDGDRPPQAALRHPAHFEDRSTLERVQGEGETRSARSLATR